MAAQIGVMQLEDGEWGHESRNPALPRELEKARK